MGTNIALILSSFLNKNFEIFKGTEEGLINEIEKICLVFSYITEKDLFLETTRVAMSDRLLNNRSFSYEAEKYFVSKLTKICGNTSFIGRMEGMLNDISAATDLSLKFKDFSSKSELKLSIEDFSAIVLRDSCWPNYTIFYPKLDPLLLGCEEFFQKFFKSLEGNSNKELKWAYTLGSCALNLTFNGKKYEIHSKTIYALVLTCLNKVPNVSFQEMLNKLNLPEDKLRNILKWIESQKHKMIETENDIVKFNSNFSSPNLLIRLQDEIEPIQMQKQKSNLMILESRAFAIDASIMKILKAKKEIFFNDLFAAIVKNTTTFTPDIEMVKERIEELLSREYITRDSEHHDKFKYSS